ncbi:MAG: helix-turn-helix domain-containing protein [Patescibacteria group bacterium]|nr:helix-turn-helix domain-containing protein [Patescibacteria group bacterium]
MQKLTEYAKIAEAARILGCSQTTLRAWADSGHLPAYRNPVNVLQGRSFGLGPDEDDAARGTGVGCV